MENSDQLLQAALARALMDTVPKEVQESVFRDALQKHLFYTADGKGQLARAFEMALEDAVRGVALELVKQPENRSRLQAAVQRHFEELIASKTVLDKVLSTIVRGY